jgi:hypothetical protein
VVALDESHSVLAATDDNLRQFGGGRVLQ